MNNLTATVIVLFVLVSIGFSQTTTKPKVKCNYLLYLPNDYKSNTKSYPLLIYLHGKNLRGNDLSILKKSGLPYLISQGQNFDFIIASPQCPDTCFWSRINWFEPLFNELNVNYRIDSNRIYGTGISMGGVGTWHLAMDYPNKIAAIITLCGGCLDSLNICKIKNVPVWAFHGAEDILVDINQTERLVNRLQKCNGNIKYTKLENKGHNLNSVFEMPEIYDWLKKQNIQKKH